MNRWLVVPAVQVHAALRVRVKSSPPGNVSPNGPAVERSLGSEGVDEKSDKLALDPQDSQEVPMHKPRQ
jgi:hypothetical protein